MDRLLKFYKLGRTGAENFQTSVKLALEAVLVSPHFLFRGELQPDPNNPKSVHAIDLLQWIVVPVKTVSAYAASRIHPEIEVEDTLAASLQFENGAFGGIVGTTAMYPGAPSRLEVSAGSRPIVLARLRSNG